jgi:hypothetical protein
MLYLRAPAPREYYAGAEAITLGKPTAEVSGVEEGDETDSWGRHGRNGAN